jgi:hypothetical protein
MSSKLPIFSRFLGFLRIPQGQPVPLNFGGKPAPSVLKSQSFDVRETMKLLLAFRVVRPMLSVKIRVHLRGSAIFAETLAPPPVKTGNEP